jgi:hypothetical protein
MNGSCTSSSLILVYEVLRAFSSPHHSFCCNLISYSTFASSLLPVVQIGKERFHKSQGLIFENSQSVVKKDKPGIGE